MENTSKALLIVAGILFGILLISLVLILWANLSKFHENSEGPDKEQQLSSFNQEFTQYNRNNVYGSDLISIVNKIESYNKNNPDFFNDKVQYEEIKLIVDFSTGDTNQSLPDPPFKKSQPINIANSRDPLFKMFKEYEELEKKYGKSAMQRLSANRQRIKDKVTKDKMSREDAIKEILGRNVNVTDADLETYAEFTEFKTSKFNCVDASYNDRGQVNQMKFEFKGR